MIAALFVEERGLEVVGRVELLDRTNNRGEAADMLAAERKRVGRG